MRIGYARVSTGDQSLNLQLDALREFGCEEIFKDHGVSALAGCRPGLVKALKHIRPGDTLVIWRLDRLARSLLNLLDTTTSLQNRDIGLHSLCEHIDTGSPSGRLVLHVMGAVAEFERAIMVERTRAGIDAAKARGVKCGRRRALDGEEFREALYLLKRGMRIPNLADHMGVGRSTLYRYLADLAHSEGLPLSA